MTSSQETSASGEMTISEAMTPRHYASLIGPLLGMYYPLPGELNKAQCRAALNSSRLKNLWHLVYSREDVLQQIRDYGGMMLPDEWARKLDYDSHIVSEWAGVGT